MNNLLYEWDAETWLDDEVHDHDHRDTLGEMSRLEADQRLVLVRDVGNRIEGLLDRLWAYVENGKLPEYFSDSMTVTGVKVPQRFHRELAKHRERLNA